jgi:hypothetical protein
MMMDSLLASGIIYRDHVQLFPKANTIGFNVR